MAQLVERLLPTSEIRDSNTVIGKIYRKLYWKDANKEKDARRGPFKNWNSKYRHVTDMTNVQQFPVLG